MHTRRHLLLAATPGSTRELLSLHYGPGGGPKATVQASLHADEVPAMLVAHHLRGLLAALEDAGRLVGEVVLVPAANPIGLAQTVLGHAHGRFELASGENFNRHYPDLLEPVFAAVHGRLGPDAADNAALVRSALREAAAKLVAETELQSLRKTLLGLAVDADVVLDLHCDNEGVMHLYTATPVWPQTEPLARLIGAEAVLLAERSGDEPFDEACSMLWPRLARRLAEAGDPSAAAPPLGVGCIAITVELRGEADVDHALAAADARALVDYLAHCGFVTGPRAELPPLKCRPSPLAGSLSVVAPHGGVLAFLRAPGDEVRRGETVADLIDPLTGSVTPLPSPVDGRLYAREHRRFASAGMRVAKVAGHEALRSGKLLSN